MRSPANTIAAGDHQRGDRIEGVHARDRDQAQPDEHADRGQRVGAQVRRVSRQGGRAVLAGAPPQVAGDAEVGDRREADHRDPDPEVLDLAADDQPAGRLEDDDPGADQDQHALDRGGQVLGLLVPVGMLAVGRLVGLSDRDQGDHRGEQIDRGVGRLGDDRDRAGDRPGGDLERDQQRVGGDREGRGARLGADHDPRLQPARRARGRRARGG